MKFQLHYYLIFLNTYLSSLFLSFYNINRKRILNVTNKDVSIEINTRQQNVAHDTPNINKPKKKYQQSTCLNPKSIMQCKK